MEKTYTVEWSEKKTIATGKEKIDARLKAQGEEPINGCTIWADFPGFANIMTGSTVVGTLTPAKDPKFGPTLYAPRPTTAPKGNSAFKQIQIEKTMDKKNESIAHFQGEKEWGIKVASTFKAAYESAIAEWTEDRRISTSNPTLDVYFKKWREFYWLNFDVKVD